MITAHTHIDNQQYNLNKVILLLTLLLASIPGMIIRYAAVGSFTFFPIQYIIHAHSHLAMMGWATPLLMMGIMVFKNLQNVPLYNRLVQVNAFICLLMFIAFLWTGYSVVSIILSTVHLVLCYIFFYHVLRNSNDHASPLLADQIINSAIFWMILGSLSTWFIPVIIATLGKPHVLYELMLAFFLHTQFFGWFTLGVLGLLLGHFPEASKHLKRQHRSIILVLLNAFVLLTFLVGNQQFSSPWINVSHIIGVLSISYVICLLPLKSLFEKLNIGSKIGLIALLAQISMLLMAAFHLSDAWMEIRHTRMGFLHLTTLGWLSLTLTSFLFPNQNLTSLVGWRLFTFGFLLTEICLLFSPLWIELLGVKVLDWSLLIAAGFFPVSLILIASSNFTIIEFTKRLNLAK